MAIVKTVLKLSERDAVVKVAGSAGTSTIDLQTDLKRTNEFVAGQTQRVSIAGVQWSGTPDAVVSVVRNGVTILTLNCATPNSFEMNGTHMIPDTIQEDQDIAVTITGTQGECYLRLKKTNGYTSGSEPSIYGQYDDPTRIGASTTMPGSPDYVAP